MDTLDEPRLRRLIQVGRSFVEELDPEALLTGILDAARELTGAQFAALGILDDRRERLVRFITRGVDPETHRAIGDLPQGRGILGVLIETPEPLRLDDLREHPRSYGFPDGHPPMASFLGMPILVHGAAWGNIYLTEKAGGPFDDADEQALTILANWAAVAVQNAHAYDEVQRRHDELARVNRELEATTAINRAIGGETDLDRILELVAKRGRALVDARCIMISLPHDDELEIAAAAGQGAQRLVGRRVPLATSTAGRVMSDRRSRRLPADELLVPPSTLGLPDAAHALVVPLVFHGKAVGVLVALDHLSAPRPFGAEEQRLLEAFAMSAATAVATAQAVSRTRLSDAVESAEHERRRWARELHDETLQAMAALRLALDAVKDEARDSSTVVALDRLSRSVGDEIAGLRSLIAELRPAALDELGLGPALESLVAGVRSRSALEVDLRVDLGGERLSPELETAVYRLVQEAMTNVVKHAEAARCEVHVRWEGEWVDVAVRDDGKGVAAEMLQSRLGFGVTGMRERAELAGGSLEIAPRAGGGTVVRTRLPAVTRP